jgi:predicted transcriptional regulator
MAKQATTIQFDEALDRKLRLYKKASGMPLAAIAGRAIDAFIDQELRQNDGLRAKYEAEEARALATVGVSMIPRRKRRKVEDVHRSEAKK